MGAGPWLSGNSGNLLVRVAPGHSLTMGELPVHQHRNALTKLAQVQRLRLQQHIRDSAHHRRCPRHSLPGQDDQHGPAQAAVIVPLLQWRPNSGDQVNTQHDNLSCTCSLHCHMMLFGGSPHTRQAARLAFPFSGGLFRKHLDVTFEISMNT